MRLTYGALGPLCLLILGCGDNVGNTPDGGNPDSPPGTPDAEEPDAMPMQTHAGQVSVVEVRVNGIPQLGTGGQIFATFAPTVDVNGVVDAPGQIFDNRDTVGQGCAAFVYNFPAMTPPANEDHGVVSISNIMATVPPCTFIGGDYRCIANAGTSGTIMDDAGGP